MEYIQKQGSVRNLATPNQDVSKSMISMDSKGGKMPRYMAPTIGKIKKLEEGVQEAVPLESQLRRNASTNDIYSNRSINASGYSHSMFGQSRKTW